LKGVHATGSLQVNGAQVNSCFLRPGDIIQIGQHVLEFQAVDTPAEAGHQAAPSAADAISGDYPSQAEQFAAEWANSKRRAFLRFVSGPDAGRIQKVDRPLVPIGDPSGYYVAVSRRTNGYFLLNLGRGLYAKVNDEPLHGGVPLQNGDLITLGDWQVEVRIFEQTQH
jgi:predicted component of type VI protein secretion system